MLTDEIAHLDRRISDLEDAELLAMEELDSTSASEQEITGRVAELEASVRALIASRDEQIAQLDAEIAAQQQARDGIATGCQIEVTPSALDGYHAAADDEVLRCEECERILVRVSTGAA